MLASALPALLLLLSTTTRHACKHVHMRTSFSKCGASKPMAATPTGAQMTMVNMPVVNTCNMAKRNATSDGRMVSVANANSPQRCEAIKCNSWSWPIGGQAAGRHLKSRQLASTLGALRLDFYGVATFLAPFFSNKREEHTKKWQVPVSKLGTLVLPGQTVLHACSSCLSISEGQHSLKMLPKDSHTLASALLQQRAATNDLQAQHRAKR